jgi:hypothetical protein
MRPRPTAGTSTCSSSACASGGIDIFDEGDDYIPQEPYTDLRHDLYPKDGTIGSAHGC